MTAHDHHEEISMTTDTPEPTATEWERTVLAANGVDPDVDDPYEKETTMNPDDTSGRTASETKAERVARVTAAAPPLTPIQQAQIRAAVDGTESQPRHAKAEAVAEFRRRIDRIAQGPDPSLPSPARRSARADALREWADALREWADGSLIETAAVELLARACHGALLDGPWIRRRGSRAGDGFWFDADLAATEGGYLSGGERRVLAVATSLVSPAHPVDLGDAATGLDPTTLRLVLETLSIAGGHERRQGLDHERESDR